VEPYIKRDTPARLAAIDALIAAGARIHEAMLVYRAPIGRLFQLPFEEAIHNKLHTKSTNQELRPPKA
jgi:hypothetical protein